VAGRVAIQPAVGRKTIALLDGGKATNKCYLAWLDVLIALSVPTIWANSVGKDQYAAN
jgi:hypothetical protein